MARLREMKADEGDELLMEYDVKSEKDICEAERIFNERIYGVPEIPEKDADLPVAKRLAFASRSKGEPEMIKRFDRIAPEVIIMPPIKGG